MKKESRSFITIFHGRMSLSENRIINLALLVLVIAVSSAVIFNKLGASTIWCWDEARHAENALEILRSGDWVVIQYGGKPDWWNLHPPLSAWLVAVAFKIFGINEFALRFWSAFCAVGTIAVVYLFGVELKNRYAAIYAALMLLTMEGFIGFHAARTGDDDIMVAFFMTLAFYLFYVGQRNKKLLLAVGSSASMALGFLTKELIILGPVIIVLYLLCFQSFKKTIFAKETKYTAITFLLLVAPWYTLRYIRGKDFFLRKFQYDIIERFTRPIEGHYGAWYYYLDMLRERGMREILLILFAIAFIYSLYLFLKKDKPASFLVIWVSVFFLVLSSTTTKNFWYLVPVYPAVSLMIAYSIEKIQESLKINRWIVMPIFLIVMLMPFLSIVKYTEEVVISPRSTAIKEIKSELGRINDIYIHESEHNQSLYFYLHVHIKGNVNVFKEPEELNLKRDDAIVTFDRNRLTTLAEKQGYQLIIKSKKIGLLRKI